MDEPLPHPIAEGLDWLGGFRDDDTAPLVAPDANRPTAPNAHVKDTPGAVRDADRPAPSRRPIRLLIAGLTLLLGLQTSAIVVWGVYHPEWQTEALQSLGSTPPPPAPAETTPTPTDTPTASPTTELVVGRAPGEIPTIAEAVARCVPGGRIRIKPGVYAGKVVLDHPIELIGDGPRTGVVIGNATGMVISVPGDRVALRGLTIIRREGVNDPHGVAVDVAGNGTILDDCDIQSGAAAAVSVHGTNATATLRNCAIHDGKNVGVQVSEGSRVILEACQVTGNNSTGVTATTGANLVLRRCQVSDGKAVGVLARDRGSVTLEDSDVTGHKLPQVSAEEAGSLTLRKCRVSAGESHGVYLSQSTAELDNCTITGNGSEGTYVHNLSRAVLNNCKIHKNKKNGLYFGDRSTGLVEKCEFRDSGTGNIVVQTGACPVVRGCTLAGGETGIVVQSKATGEFTDCEISGHETGIFVFGRGNPVFRNCKVHGNRASGVYVAGHGKGTFDGCDLGPHPQSVVMLVSGAEPILRNCKIHDGDLHGVTIWDGATGSLEGCAITGMKGAGVYVEDSDGHPLLRDCKVRDCQGSGVVFTNRARGTLIDCELTGNKGANLLSRAAEVNLIRCRILAGTDLGVVARTSGQITLTDCEVRDHPDNSVLIGEAVAAILTRCQVSGGKKFGLTIVDKARVTLNECDISGHTNHDVIVFGDGGLMIRGGSIQHGKESGVALLNNSRAVIMECRLADHEKAEIFTTQTARAHLQKCNLTTTQSNDVYARADSAVVLDGCELHGGKGDTVYAMEKAAISLRDCVLSDGQANGVSAIDSARVDMTGGQVNRHAGVGIMASGGGELTLLRVLAQESGMSGVFVCGAKAAAVLVDCRLDANHVDGLTVTGDGHARADHCRMEGNLYAIRAQNGGRVVVADCVSEKNTLGSWASLGLPSNLSGSGNTPSLGENTTILPVSSIPVGDLGFSQRYSPPSFQPGTWSTLFPQQTSPSLDFDRPVGPAVGRPARPFSPFIPINPLSGREVILP